MIQTQRPQKRSPGESRYLARYLALGLTVAILASGLALNSALVATAAVSGNTITAPGSPLSKITMNPLFRFAPSDSTYAFSTTITSAAHGEIWWAYPEGPGAITTGGGGADNNVTLIKPDNSVAATGAPLERSSSGTGTADDPWILTRTYVMDGGASTLTRTDSYTEGAPSVRSDVTVKNLTATALPYAITQYADCKFGGDDRGTNEYGNGDRVATCVGAGGRIALVDQSGGSQLYLGSTAPVRKASRLYADFPTGRVCPVADDPTINSTAACLVYSDNAAVIRWKENIAPHASVTRTFLSTDSDQMRFADLRLASSASVPTVAYGDSYDYNLALNNIGLDTATAARATFKLPKGVVFDAAEGNGTYNPATGVWSVGDLANQATANLRIRVTAQAQVLGVQKAGFSAAKSAQEIDLTECSVAGSPECGPGVDVEITQTLDPAAATATVRPTRVVANGADTTLITVSTRDTRGLPMLTSREAGKVSLSTSLGTLGPVVAATDASGTYTAKLSSPRAGVATIAGAVAQAPLKDIPAVTFTAGGFAPGASSVTTTNPTAIADGHDAHTVTLTVKDAQGNPLAVDAAQIAAKGEKLSFSPWTAGTTPGTATATVTSSSAGDLPFALTYAGTAFAGTPKLTFVPGPVSAETSVLTVAKNRATANGTDAIIATVQLKDATGNNIAAGTRSVNFTTTRGSLGEAKVTEKGAVVAPLTATTAGEARLGFSVGAAVAKSTVTVSFDAGDFDPAGSSVVVSSGEVLADGAAAHTVTVKLRDRLGNPVIGVPRDLGASSDPEKTVTFGEWKPGGTGEYSAPVTSTVAGDPAITVAYQGRVLTGSGQTVRFVPGEVSASRTTVTVGQDQLVANGEDATTVTVIPRDAHGNRVLAQPEAFLVSTTVGRLIGEDRDAEGTYTARLTSLATGTAQIRASVANVESEQHPTVEFIAGPLSPPDSHVEAPSGTAIADGQATHTVKVRLTDAEGNAVAANRADLRAQAEPASGVAVSAFRAVKDSAGGDLPGAFEADVTSTVAGRVALTVTYRGEKVSEEAVRVRFIAGPVDPAQSLFELEKPFIEATGTDSTAITVTLRDAQKNIIIPAAGHVRLETTAGTLTAPQITEEGTVTTRLSSDRAGTATVTATAGQVNLGHRDVELVAVPAPPRIEGSNGKTVSGVADPGAVVSIRDAAQTEIARGSASATGEFTIALSPARVDGEVLHALATESHGFVSTTVTFTVDTREPILGRLDPTVGEAISGSTEPGATVEILNAEGTVIAQGRSDDAGAFRVALHPAAERGSTLGIRLSDRWGNASAVFPFRVTRITALASPETGHPGDRIAVVGQGFQPQEKVSLRLSLGSAPALTAVADQKGVVSFLVDIPRDAAPGGWIATLSADFSGSTTAAFTVIAETAPPAPGSDAGHNGAAGTEGGGGTGSDGGGSSGADHNAAAGSDTGAGGDAATGNAADSGDSTGASSDAGGDHRGTPADPGLTGTGANVSAAAIGAILLLGAGLLLRFWPWRRWPGIPRAASSDTTTAGPR